MQFASLQLNLQAPIAYTKLEFKTKFMSFLRSREVANALAKQFTGYDGTVVKNPKHTNKLGRFMTCHTKHGAVCKQDHNVEVTAACAAHLQQCLKFHLGGKDGATLLRFFLAPPLMPLYFFLASTALKPALCQVCIGFDVCRMDEQGLTLKLKTDADGIPDVQTSHMIMHSIVSSTQFLRTFSVQVVHYSCFIADERISVSVGDVAHTFQMPPSQGDLAMFAEAWAARAYEKKKTKTNVTLSFGLRMPKEQPKKRRIQSIMASSSESEPPAKKVRAAGVKSSTADVPDSVAGDEKDRESENAADSASEEGSLQDSSDDESLPDFSRAELASLKKMKKQVRKNPTDTDTARKKSSFVVQTKGKNPDQKDLDKGILGADNDPGGAGKTYFHRDLGLCGMGVAPSGRSVCMECSSHIRKGQARFEYAFNHKRPPRNLHVSESCLQRVLPEHRKQSLAWIASCIIELKQPASATSEKLLKLKPDDFEEANLFHNALDLAKDALQG